MQPDHDAIRSSRYDMGWPILLLLAIVFASTIALYSCSASFVRTADSSTFYGQLGQAFLSGHSYIDAKPSPELLALPNPYDPKARIDARILWDASLYQGRYYLYFGPVPALLAASLQCLTGNTPDDRILAFFFCTAGTYYFLWLLSAIARGRPGLLQWGVICTAIAACFGNWIFLMLRRPSFYEVAISGAYCFTALGLLSLWHGIFYPNRYSGYWKLLGSFCLGLAAGCRIIHACNILILLCLLFNSIKHSPNVRAYLREALYICAPWSICILGIGLYNFARFGSPFESGWSYQLSIANQNAHALHFWMLSNIWPDFYDYFLKPLPLKAFAIRHPFLHVPMGWDKPYGLWTNTPFSLWSLWLLAHIRSCKTWLGNAYALVIGLILYSFVITLFMLSYQFSINRYLVDFTPWMMLLAGLGYMHALQTSPQRWHRLLIISGAITALWSAYACIAAAAAS